MATQSNTSEKVFDVPKKEAIRLVGRSEKTLQRWVSEDLIEVEYRDGPYGKEAYYNRDDLLQMRRGKPRHKGDDAPLAKADLAVIARGAEWSNEQLSRALANISQQLPIIQEQLQQLVKAKDETIKTKEEQAHLQKRIGQLEQSETHLKDQQSQLQSQLGKLKEQYQQAARYRQYFQGAVLWGIVMLLVVLGLSLAFAPQLQELRELIASLLLR
jgi:DNA-binding transcriptional MerR regulator